MKRILNLMAVLALSAPVYAQLQAGSLMFVALNTDGTDGLSFASLDTLPARTTIYFTDNEWQGSNFTTGESYSEWSTASTIMPGAVITITDLNQGFLNAGSPQPNTTIGQVVWSTTTAPDNGSGLANSNERVYMYLAASYDAIPSLFITAVSTNHFSTPSGGLVGTGLTEGVNALGFNGSNPDLKILTGSLVCETTIEDCIAMFADPDNFTTENGAGYQSTDGVGVDFPFSVPIAIGGSVLPISLVSFTGVMASNGVELNWTTASEYNSDQFIIEHNLSNQEFTPAGTLPAAGFSEEANSYSFLAPAGTGWNYYRLLELTMDGEYRDGGTVAVRVDQDREALLYPNPAVGSATLYFPCEGQVQLINLQGQVIWQAALNGDLQIPLHNLPAGYYRVHLMSGAMSTSLSLMVQ